jgi:ankyrin repeat protein
MEPASKKATLKQIKKLYHYIEQDYTQLLDNLLTECEFSRTAKGEALLHAIRSKKINCVGVLLGHNVNVNGGNSHKQTPLLEAVLDRQLTTAKWLLIHGADPDRRSLLTNLNDIPSVLECVGSDSDETYITPIALAQARMQSRGASKIDTTLFNMLSKPSESWEDESLQKEIKVSTTSCIEAIKHSDHQTLIEYLKKCRYTGQLLKTYLNDRLKLAACMGNLEAMRILIKAGAAHDCVFQNAVTSFDGSAITSFIVKQYVNDLQVQKAIKRTRNSHFDPSLHTPSLRKFNEKKQRTLDLLTDTRTLVINTLTQHQNIGLSLQRREFAGTHV